MIPALLSCSDVDEHSAIDFAEQVLERFRNPFIDHEWLAITLQFSTKMKMRNVILIQSFYNKHNTAPECMALGMAAHMLFMKPKQNLSNEFVGEIKGQAYPIRDDNAAYYAQKWHNQNGIEEIAEQILSDKDFWGHDLTLLPGFKSAVVSKLHILIQQGAAAALQPYGINTLPL